MHLGGFTLGGEHRGEAVGEIEHRVAELPELVVGGYLNLIARYELRYSFLVFDLGEARLVVLPHGPRLGVLRRAEDLGILVCLAAPVDRWRMGLRVAGPLFVGHIGVYLPGGQCRDAARLDGLLAVLTETPRCRAYARWLMIAMQRFLNFPLAFRGDRSDESSCADHPPKGKAPR